MASAEPTATYIGESDRSSQLSAERKKRAPVSDQNEKYDGRQVGHFETASKQANERLANPLEGIPQDQVWADAANFAHEHGLGHLADTFSKGALVAQDSTAFESLPQLTAEDKEIFRREQSHRWDHPITLYWLVVLCSVAAAVQGVGSPYGYGRICLTLSSQMDEAVINGANLFFPTYVFCTFHCMALTFIYRQFGIPTTGEGASQRNQWLVGLVNSAPYVSPRPCYI